MPKKVAECIFYEVSILKLSHHCCLKVQNNLGTTPYTPLLEETNSE